MTSNRLWVFGTAIVIVAVLALGWFLGVSPKLTELAAANASLAAVQAQNAQHQADLLALKEQFEAIDELRGELEDLQAAIPSDLSLPDFIRQLNALAAATGVSIDSISTSAPASYMVPATPGSLVDGEGNTIPMPVAPADLITINFVITVAGPAGSIHNFTRGLQTGERLFLVTELVINPGSGTASASGEDAEASFTGAITGLAFVLEQPDAVPAS